MRRQISGPIVHPSQNKDRICGALPHNEFPRVPTGFKVSLKETLETPLV